MVLQLWTLPGLEPVKVFSLSCCLGFPWSWQSEASLLTNLHHMCCLAPDGHMALVAPCNEVVTLGVLRGLHPPTPLKGLYDRDLSEAAIAAAGAIADLQEKREPWSGVTPHDATASTEGKCTLQAVCVGYHSVEVSRTVSCRCEIEPPQVLPFRVGSDQTYSGWGAGLPGRMLMTTEGVQRADTSWLILNEGYSQAMVIGLLYT